MIDSATHCSSSLDTVVPQKACEEGRGQLTWMVFQRAVLTFSWKSVWREGGTNVRSVLFLKAGFQQAVSACDTSHATLMSIGR